MGIRPASLQDLPQILQRSRRTVADRNQKTGFSRVPGVFEEDGGGCALREYGYEIRL